MWRQVWGSIRDEIKTWTLHVPLIWRGVKCLHLFIIPLIASCVCVCMHACEVCVCVHVNISICFLCVLVWLLPQTKCSELWWRFHHFWEEIISLRSSHVTVTHNHNTQGRYTQDTQGRYTQGRYTQGRHHVSIVGERIVEIWSLRQSQTACNKWCSFNCWMF